MRATASLLVICGLLCVSVVNAQPPRRSDGPGRDSSGDGANLVNRMMTFDANQDGKLSKEEVTDQRLANLFERADEDKDGVVTKEELLKLQSSESGNRRKGPGGGPGGGGFGGPGGPGASGTGMPPRAGEILSPPVKDALRLSSAQRKKIEALQKYVDSKMEQILTEEQRRHLDSLQRGRHGGPDDEHGPVEPPPGGGRGGDGGRGGENGRGGEGGRLPRPPQ